VAAVLLVGLNPAWLVWGVGGAHNDSLMLLLQLGAVALWLRGSEGPGAALAGLAVGVKAPAFLLLAFLVAGSRDRWRALTGALAGLAVVAVVSLAVFGSLGPVTAARNQSQMHTNKSLLGQVERLLDAPSAIAHAQTPAAIVFGLVFAGLLLWVVRRGRTVRTPRDTLLGAGWATAALLLALTWELPWYVGWLLPLAALTGSGRLRLVALTFSGALLLAFVPPHYVFVT
jgi:hypothetical protein